MNRRDDPEDVTLDDVECVRQTDKAIFVELEDGRQAWIPQSVVTDDSEVYAAGHKGKLVIKGWFAAKEGYD